ncbi:unnamed protein product [Porites evermanni]|uniref:Uncharacterized protein n=1 Tax=Porites evermanni TaxID=104178 RepID=A0ABN8RHS2_9CNID|nr:unnamed protein product [Porites evermanni]
MEQLQADIEGKRKLLLFTLGKQSVLESGKVLAIKRHREALSTIANQIDTLKLQVVEEKFKASDSEEDIAQWSQEIEQQVAQVDTQVTNINEHLAGLKLEEDSKAQESENELKAKEREDQLRFEKAQLEQKLEYEQKIEKNEEKLCNKVERSKSQPRRQRGRAH